MGELAKSYDNFRFKCDYFVKKIMFTILKTLCQNDVYRGLNLTQGSAVFGAGLLKDHEGDDTYDAYGSAQGSAEYGVGILHDEAGSDSYSCFCNAQGYAGPMGFGLLLDKGASPDTYTARDTPLDIPSAQTPEHNTSMAQGVACGRRADYLDGHSIAGGVGVLCDDGGNNTLTCGVFGQERDTGWASGCAAGTRR